MSSVDSLDSLMADMETFRNQKPSRRVEIEVEQNLEKKLESLTDQLLDAFKPGSEDIETKETKDSLGESPVLLPSPQLSPVQAPAASVEPPYWTVLCWLVEHPTTRPASPATTVLRCRYTHCVHMYTVHCTLYTVHCTL